MKRFFMLMAVVALSAALAGAATVTCDAPPNPGVPVDVIGLTIVCGSLTIDGFSVVPAAGPSSAEVDLVSATFTGGVADLVFNPNMLVAAGGHADIHLFFTVIGGIDRIDLGVGGSRASTIETVCDSAFGSGGICPDKPLATVIAYSGLINQPIWSEPFGENSPVYIFKDINVDGRDSDVFGAAGAGALSNFTQSFHTVVPEPASLGLLGTALVGLAALARRKMARG